MGAKVEGRRDARVRVESAQVPRLVEVFAEELARCDRERAAAVQVREEAKVS